MVIKDFKKELNREKVLCSINCYPDSVIYKDVVEEYEEMIAKAKEILQPRAVITYDVIPFSIANEEVVEGTPALYVIETIGQGISDWSNELFQQGKYTKGLLANAIADVYLFQIIESLRSQVEQMAKDRGMGIVKRLEPPVGVGIEAQRVIFEMTEAKERLQMKIHESFMLEPAKSAGQIFLLDSTCKEYHTEHDCRACPNLNCGIRHKIEKKITILNHKVITSKEDISLLELLRKENIYVPAVCSGRGSCGKCKVRVSNSVSNVSILAADRKAFTKEQLDDGWRLACTLYPLEDMTIELPDAEEDQMEMVSALFNTMSNTKVSKSLPKKAMIGIDIGTTTIALALVDLDTGKIVNEYLCINKQRSFGADVISRIQASNEGNRDELRECICKELYEGITILFEKLTMQSTLEKIVITGNTTMLHLLMGYSCETLGIYPFKPYRITEINILMEELFAGSNIRDNWKKVPVIIMPGISAFVGADIVSDVYICEIDKSTKINMLIDLGTNGEMAIGNNEQILTTSTAAGPAFEGGNIINGTGSIPGAICNVQINKKEVKLQTIQDKVPTGICGTGVIATVYELRKENVIDETGLLSEPYDEEGYLLGKKEDGQELRFYQKDIRELQLAKSAIRVGIEILLRRYKTTMEEVENVYIAGGFGYHLDVQKAIGIGLLPIECKDKIKMIGNGSLEGAISYGMNKQQDRVANIIKNSREIELSLEEDFNELYLKHLNLFA